LWKGISSGVLKFNILMFVSSFTSCTDVILFLYSSSKNSKGTIVLAHRLKQARLRAGLSQEKLGKLAGIDPMSASARMNQYERGKHSPDYQLMCRVAEILKMPVSWFYTEDEDLARLQEIYYHLSPIIRGPLLTQAENLFGATPPGANEEQTSAKETSSPAE
jgi:transcriptional regulator with XRE-family HTH domain